MHFWVMDWPLLWLNIASLNTPDLSKVAAFDLGSQPLIIHLKAMTSLSISDASEWQ